MARLRPTYLLCLTLALGLPAVGCSSQPLPPPADDAFLSYLQIATSLARELAHPQPLPPANKEQKEQLEKQMAAACDKLLALQAKVEQLSPADRERLCKEHAVEVHAATTAWQELEREHARMPQKFGEKWSKYAEAFRFCGELATQSRN